MMKAASTERAEEALVIAGVDLVRPYLDEVRIEMGASGVCHSDLSPFQGQCGSLTDIIPRREGAERERRHRAAPLDATGRVGPMRYFYHVVYPGGPMAFVGAVQADREPALPARDLYANAKRILGTSHGNAQLRRDTLRPIAPAEAGQLHLDLMGSERVPLSEVNTAFYLMERGDVSVPSGLLKTEE